MRFDPPTPGYGKHMAEPVADDARLLAGRYRLLERIGSGGMGSVHLAHDEVLDRVVAIKLLHAEGGAGSADDDEVRRERLRAEARFAGALRHPGIVAVYDYGEERRGDLVTPYVVMQLVPGRPLSEVLRESGSLPADDVRALVEKVADALAAAHAAGIVHRDLKPSNILLPDTGQPVIVDFGIARSDEVDPLTRTGEIIGTADYLSPEQVRGQRATGASDIYALGVIAYKCLTGTSPFHRETHVATALAHLTDAPPPLPSAVPADLRALVHAMLDDDPTRRPAAGAVAGRLPDEATGALPVPERHRLRRPRAAAVACAAAVLLVAGAVVAVAVDGDPAAPPAAAGLAVPSVRGDQLDQARRELRAAGFDVDVRRVETAAPAGRVLGQNPAPGPYPGDDPPTVVLRVAAATEAPSPTSTAPTSTAPTSTAATTAPPPEPTAEPKPAKAKPGKGGPGKGGPGRGKGHGPKHRR